MRQKYCPEVLQHLLRLSNVAALGKHMRLEIDSKGSVTFTEKMLPHVYTKDFIADILKSNSWLRSKQLMWEFLDDERI